MGGRKAIALCVLLAALFVADCGASAQSPELPITDRVPNCDELLESARKLRGVSLAMLATLRDRRDQLEKMRVMLDSDVVAESIAVLSDQETKLLQTLRAAEAAACSSVSPPPQDDAPATPAARP
jgi:hypothetical protein